MALVSRCPICHTDRVASQPPRPPHYWCTDPFHEQATPAQFLREFEAAFVAAYPEGLGELKKVCGTHPLQDRTHLPKENNAE